MENGPEQRCSLTVTGDMPGWIFWCKKNVGKEMSVATASVTLPDSLKDDLQPAPHRDTYRSQIKNKIYNHVSSSVTLYCESFEPNTW